jgi:transposase
MLKTRSEVEDWLDKYGVENYTINEDLTVDVEGYVNLYNKGLKSIDVQFGVVNGSFDCSYNKLTSLKGSPKKVTIDFNCSSNRLESLEDGPIEVTDDYNCRGNILESLKGSPEIVKAFICTYNELESLEDGPKKVTKRFNCSNNYLTSLEGGPKEVGDEYRCSYNRLTTLKGCPEEVKGNFKALHNSDLKSIKYAPKTKPFPFEDKKLDSLLDDYIKLINKIGYDKTQQYWPTIEKMKPLGDEWYVKV